MSDLVSVIITTYKRRVQQINKAIRSVLNQSYGNWELIIVDDSPADYMYREEVKEYCNGIQDKRVQYIQHKENMGACVARNTGLNLAKGKYITFLDDDDEYFENRIEKLIILFSDEIDLVYSNSKIIIVGKKSCSRAFDKGTQYRGKVYKNILAENFIGSTSVVMIRTVALRNIGGFDPKLEASQDWDVWIRLCQNGNVEYTDEILVNYYVYFGERITNDTEKRLRALLCLNEKNKNELELNIQAKIQRKIYEMRLKALTYDLKGTAICYFQIIKMRPRCIVKNIVCAKSFARLFIKKINA